MRAPRIHNLLPCYPGKYCVEFSNNVYDLKQDLKWLVMHQETMRLKANWCNSPHVSHIMVISSRLGEYSPKLFTCYLNYIYQPFTFSRIRMIVVGAWDEGGYASHHRGGLVHYPLQRTKRSRDYTHIDSRMLDFYNFFSFLLLV